MDGYYLATTDKADKAVTVYVEAVEGTEGAYRLYFMNGEVKTYIEVYEREAGAAGKGKGSVKLVTEAPATHYTYDATAKTFVFTAADGVNSYYLGTYSSYNTFSVSNAAYITGNNASKVDVSQFPARMATVKAVKVAPVIPEAPAAGTAYKFNLNQVTLGKNFYFAGYMDGYYLATTDKLSKAVDVFVEAVEGTEGAYRLYFMNGEVKTYIEVYEREAGAAGKGKGSVKLVTEAPATHYTYDATAKTFVFTAADGVNSYYLGTYSSYNTFSVSNAAYITGNNASKVDVSQFPARVVTIEVVVPTTPDQGGDNTDTPVTPAPDAPAIAGSLATFSFGANGEAAHADGADIGTTKTYTSGDYTLVLTDASKVFDGAFDAKGNSCLKLGTGSVNSTFKFTVVDGVKKVVIRVSSYKAKEAKVTVNGTEYDLKDYQSNDGEYFEITIDTTTNKTVEFASVSGSNTQRVMIDAIAYFG